MLTSAELREYHEAEKWLDLYAASALRQGIDLVMYSTITVGRYAALVLKMTGSVEAACSRLRCTPDALTMMVDAWEEHKALADRMALESTKANVV